MKREDQLPERRPDVCDLCFRQSCCDQPLLFRKLKDTSTRYKNQHAYALDWFLCCAISVAPALACSGHVDLPPEGSADISRIGL